MKNLEKEVRELIVETTLLPPEVKTTERLNFLFDVGRSGLSLAKLAEAHWDALSILQEASRPIAKELLYAVWASEIPQYPLKIDKSNPQWTLNGTKMFCSGAGIVDHALVSAEGWLIDIELTSSPSQHLQINTDNWITSAFKDTNTATLTFNNFPINGDQVIGEHRWYLERSGFWKGALGPAACWAGGAAGLVDYALSNSRKDPHTLAHLAAMEANIWTLRSVLDSAGKELADSLEETQMQKLALRVRHIIEQRCTEILIRFARAYGPFPLACDALISQRYQELELFLRQNHAERDLETLGLLL